MHTALATELHAIYWLTKINCVLIGLEVKVASLT